MTAEEKWKAAIAECGAELTSRYPGQEYYLALQGDDVKLFYYDENATGPWDEDSPYGMILLPSLDEIRRNEMFRKHVIECDGYTQGCIDAYNDWFDGKTDECPLDGEDLYGFATYGMMSTLLECDYTIYSTDIVKKTVKYAVYIDVEVPEDADESYICQEAMDKAATCNYNIFEDALFEEITD